jgi:hypothetical protein
MSAVELPPAACDTFPKLLEHHRRLRPGRPAIREKDYGIWQTHNWGTVAESAATRWPSSATTARGSTGP